MANSLTAVVNGARQVECTINGIGERAGNASLEEIVMALRTRKDFFGLDTRVKTEEIFRASRLLSHITGVHVQPNKAIVGENAFAHEAGIHQDGVLKEKLTYEIMRPEDIGRPSNKLVLGKHSGRHALAARLKDLGFDLAGGDLDRAFRKFKDLADRKKEVYDEDLMSIVTDEATKIPETYELDYLHVISGTGIVPSATIRLRREEQLFQDSGVGDGPVDAALAAIDAITGTKGRLIDYALRAATSGKDAIGEVSVKVDFDGTVVSGKGASTDVIEASVRAYLSAQSPHALQHPAHEGSGALRPMASPVRIALLPGDGIGQEVVPEAVRAPDRGQGGRLQPGVRAGMIGGAAIDAVAHRCPRRRCGCAGRPRPSCSAVGGPKWDHLPQEQKAERGLLALRKELDLYANLRPARCFPMLVDASPLCPRWWRAPTSWSSGS